MKRLRKKWVILIGIIFLVLVWVLLTWFGIVPNWFNIEFYDGDNYRDDDGDNYRDDGDCGHKEYQYNKKIVECNDKCVVVSGYSERAFTERYFDKYGEKPKALSLRYSGKDGEGRAHLGYSDDGIGLIYSDMSKYPRDFSSKYTGYNEWIEAVFPYDIEVINEYNECIRKCGPMAEQPGCID